MNLSYRLRGNRLHLSNVPDSFLLDLSNFEGRRYHRDLGAWSLSRSYRSAKFLADHGYTSPDIPVTYNTAVPRTIGPYNLFNYQIEGVRFLDTLDFGLLYDAPGVGKTLQAVAWAYADETCLVVCPKAVVDHWKTHLENVGKSPVTYPKELKDGQWGITTWQRQDVRVPLGYTLIPDEVHYAKNIKTGRSKKLHALGARAGRILALSGTPLINRPLELWSIFLLLRERQRDDYWRFVQHYCAAYHNGFGWDVSGASNLDDLRDEMAHFSLRRTLDEVAPQLPPKRYETVHIKLTGAERNIVNERTRQLSELVSGKALLSSEGLGALQRLRMASAQAKAKYVNEWLLDYCASGGGAVAVFSTFKAPLSQAIENLPAVLYTGDVSEQLRHAAIQALDKGTAQVIGLTYGAGGTGLDGLQRTCDCVALLDLPWTPAETGQAEDRVHRIGQRKSVQVVRFVCDGWIDQKVEEARDRKMDLLTYLMEE